MNAIAHNVAVEIGPRDPETGRVPVRLPKPRVSDPGFFGGLLAEWQAEEVAKADALLIADTLAAADDAETAARDFARGLASVERLILASDRAFHAGRRADVRWVDMHREGNTPRGAAELHHAAERARRAYSAAARI